MREPTSNIAVVCAKHAPKPKRSLHRHPLDFYVGKHVKLAFDSIWIGGGTEHLWVRVQAIEGVGGAKRGRLVGVIDNDPVIDIGRECGDEVRFYRSRIEAIV